MAGSGHFQKLLYSQVGLRLDAPEAQGEAHEAEPVAKETAQVAQGRQAVVAEEVLAESLVLGVLLPQRAVGVGAPVAAGHLPAEAVFPLHGLQGPHGGRGAGPQPQGVAGGQREAQEQQAELVAAGGEQELSLGGQAGP